MHAEEEEKGVREVKTARNCLLLAPYCLSASITTSSPKTEKEFCQLAQGELTRPDREGASAKNPFHVHTSMSDRVRQSDVPSENFLANSLRKDALFLRATLFFLVHRTRPGFSAGTRRSCLAELRPVATSCGDTREIFFFQLSEITIALVCTYVCVCVCVCV